MRLKLGLPDIDACPAKAANMFEAKPPIAHHARGSAHGTFADEDLIAFSWDDLVARLNASQELRDALSHIPSAARASFDAQAADRLANRRKNTQYNSKQTVNPVASVNGRATGSKDSSRADSAWPTVRGIA